MRAAFTPANPISNVQLFSGRTAELQQVGDAFSARGRHVILFGERGVGKTSLANIVEANLRSTYGEPLLVLKANCESGDDSSSLWRKIFSELKTVLSGQSVGFSRERGQRVLMLLTHLGTDPISSDDVRRVLTEVAREHRALVIVDEFDRPKSPTVSSAMTDVIKMLADRDVPVTIMLVGVAGTVDLLLSEHASVSRSLTQVQMPRMSDTELRQIVLNGLRRSGMSIAPPALGRIVAISQGYPHYTHLLALGSGLAANDDGRDVITETDVDLAVTRAVSQVQHSISAAYARATESRRAQNRYAEIILACALASTDRARYFTPGAVAQALQVLGRKHKISTFAQYLKDFAAPARGAVLEQAGDPRRYRYRFAEPLMAPYVVMRGLAEGAVPAAAVPLPMS